MELMVLCRNGGSSSALHLAHHALLWLLYPFAWMGFTAGGEVSGRTVATCLPLHLFFKLHIKLLISGLFLADTFSNMSSALSLFVASIAISIVQIALNVCCICGGISFCHEFALHVPICGHMHTVVYLL